MGNESRLLIAKAAARGAMLSCLLLFAAFPILWIILTSFKSDADIISKDPKFFFVPTLEHWSDVFESDFLEFYWNSMIIATVTVVVVLVVSTMAGYALARLDFKGSENLAFFILSQRMMPPVAVVLPIFLLFRDLDLLDTRRGLIALNVAFTMPLAIWMLRSFIASTPVSLEEAAIVDGASRTGAFLRVTLPQIKAGLFSTGLLVFVFTLNEFFFAMILSGTDARPVTVAVQLFLPTGVRGTLFGEAAAASLLVMAPSMSIAIAMQRHLVSGISLGAVKG